MFIYYFYTKDRNKNIASVKFNTYVELQKGQIITINKKNKYKIYWDVLSGETIIKINKIKKEIVIHYPDNVNVTDISNYMIIECYCTIL